jgi:hypothetical protein
MTYVLHPSLVGEAVERVLAGEGCGRDVPCWRCNDV